MKKEYYLKQARKSKIILFFLVGIPFFLIQLGCSNTKIDEDIVVRFYVDNIIAEEKYSYNSDSLHAYQQKIVERYHINKNQFEDYLKSLKADQLKWQSFFKKAEEYLIELRRKGTIK